LHQIGDLFELTVKLWCQNVKIETKGKDTCGHHNTVSYLPVCYVV